MAQSITCLHVNHLNALVEDVEDSLAHFRDLYGAQFLLDKPESEYCLIAIGTVIFELFDTPKLSSPRPVGAQLQRPRIPGR